MNLNDFVVLPNSAAKSVKLNARNLQELKMETGSLAQESDEMEEKLKRLKERMSQEKEERAYCYFSQSEIQGYSCAKFLPLHCIQSKFFILFFFVSIAVLPPPPSPATAAPKPMRKSKLKGITCGQCEVRTAGVKCAECSEDYCIGCFSKFHQKGALKFHSIIPIQTEQDPGNKQLGLASNQIPNPKAPDHAWQVPSQIPKTILIVHDEENNHFKSETEPSLLNGKYDEEESAKSFQDALRQWREPLVSTTLSFQLTGKSRALPLGSAPSLPQRTDTATASLQTLHRSACQSHAPSFPHS
uniref:B box-type domain-containing protein n=1 Tax=Periophthalmus magnuspinnatus TaxID=409849 RepID=A0A3B4AJX3_9GOBI